jgi:hypothetical protein
MVRPGDDGMSDGYSCDGCFATIYISLLLAFPYDMFSNLVYHVPSSNKKQISLSLLRRIVLKENMLIMLKLST